MSPRLMDDVHVSCLSESQLIWCSFTFTVTATGRPAAAHPIPSAATATAHRTAADDAAGARSPNAAAGVARQRQPAAVRTAARARHPGGRSAQRVHALQTGRPRHRQLHSAGQLQSQRRLLRPADRLERSARPAGGGPLPAARHRRHDDAGRPQAAANPAAGAIRPRREGPVVGEPVVVVVGSNISVLIGNVVADSVVVVGRLVAVSVAEAAAAARAHCSDRGSGDRRRHGSDRGRGDHAACTASGALVLADADSVGCPAAAAAEPAASATSAAAAAAIGDADLLGVDDCDATAKAALRWRDEYGGVTAPAAGQHTLAIPFSKAQHEHKKKKELKAHFTQPLVV